jgi:predicted nucleotidyltransferase
VQKTFDLAKPLRHALATLAKKLDAAFVYGSVGKNTDTAGSDIDRKSVEKARPADERDA